MPKKIIRKKEEKKKRKMRSQKSSASWQDTNPSGWFGMVEKRLCRLRL